MDVKILEEGESLSYNKLHCYMRKYQLDKFQPWKIAAAYNDPVYINYLIEISYHLITTIHAFSLTFYFM